MSLLKKMLLYILSANIIFSIILSVIEIDLSVKAVAKTNSEYLNSLASMVDDKINIYYEMISSIMLSNINSGALVKFGDDYTNSESENVVKEDIDRLLSDFANLKNSLPIIESVMLLSPKGNVLFSTNSSDMELKKNYQDSLFFHNSITDLNRFVITAYDKVSNNDIESSKSGNLEIVSRLSKAIISKNTKKIVGVFVITVFLRDFVDKYISKVTPYENGYIFLTSGSDQMIYHPLEEYMSGKSKLPDNIVENPIWKNRLGGIVEYTDQNGKQSMIDIKINRLTNISICVKSYVEDIHKSSNNIKKAVFFILIIIISVYSVLLFFIIKSIVDSIVIGINFASQIGDGNLTTSIPNNFLRKKDEIGKLSKALSSMRDELKNFILSTKDISENLKASSLEMKNASVDIASQASSQAASVEEISSSMEEISGNIETSLYNTKETEDIALDVARLMKDGQNTILDTFDAMKEISIKIENIKDIASNTNLISLNASIEAARAGEAGVGFSVVAQEIMDLANKSSKTSEEIYKLSRKTMQLSEKTEMLLENISPKIQKTAELVSLVSTSMSQQTLGINQIKSAILNLDKSIQANASASEQLTGISEMVEGHSNFLSNGLNMFITEKKPSNNNLTNKKKNSKKKK